MRLKDIADPYIPFTLMAMTFPAMVMLLNCDGGNYIYGIMTLAALFCGLTGLHAFDIMKGGYRDITPRFQSVKGALFLLIAVSIGVYVSLMVNPSLLILVGIETLVGIGYNIELFGGALHDGISGKLIFGISWTFIPCVYMSVVMGTASISIILFALGWTIFIIPVLLLYEAAKPLLHKIHPLIDNPGDGPDLHDTKMAIIISIFTWILAFWLVAISFALRYEFGL